MKLEEIQKKLNSLPKSQKKALLNSLHQRSQKTKEISYPCTYAQERFLFQHQMEPGIGVCNTPIFARIQGNISVDFLQDSINQVIKRHAPLRTYFIEEELKQVVVPEAEILINQVDISHLEPKKKKSHLDKILKDVIDQRFSICKAPLIRASLIKEGPNKYILAMAIHHIVMDGWSLEIFLKELIENYHLRNNNLPLAKERLSFTYEDYVNQQKSENSTLLHASQMSYWIEKLKNIPSQLMLPTDFPRPLERTCFGKTKNYKFPLEVTNAISCICKDHAVSNFMALSTALTFLLSRYTNMTDILIGSPHGGRGNVEAEKLIGLFQNMLVFRNDCSDDPTFYEMLQRVKDTTLEAYDHADVPFEKIVKEVNPKRERGFTPIFQVLLSHNNAPQEEVTFSDLTLTPYLIEVDRVDCDLTFMYSLTGNLVTSLRIEYSTDLFSEDSVDRICKHLQRIILQASQNNKIRLSEIKLVDKEEQEHLIRNFCEGEKSPPLELCLHHMFEVKAKKVPDQIAVIQGLTQMTYRELDQKSSQLAKRILEITDGKNRVIPIVMDQSIAMIVSMYGILRAGCAYTIIDPQNPIKRIEYMLRDTHSDLCIVARDYVKQISHFEKNIIIFESLHFKKKFEQIPSFKDQNRVAYVLYTSGTTGNPKGVKIQHKGVVNTLDFVIKKHPFSEKDKLLSISPPYFDISIIDFFGILSMGGTIVLAGISKNLEVLNWYELVREHGITIWNSVPALMELFIQDVEARKEKIETLRLVILGGDRIPTTLPDRIRSFCNSTTNIFELGGPTECSVASNTYEIDQVPAHWMSIPYGKPIQNMQIYILDDRGSLLPQGIEGDLYVSGIGLSEGYLNNTILTKEKFLKNPYSKQYPIMYQTGDRGRYFADGNIEFKGRSDFQVKIHGIRVELGEISSVIELHPNILQAATIQNKISEQHSELVAFVVLKQKNNDFLDELKTYLKERLPQHLLPTDYIFMDSLPLSKNGKLDREQLADMVVSGKTAPNQMDSDSSDHVSFMYEVSWEKKTLEEKALHADLYLVFQDSHGIGEKLIKKLEEKNRTVISIHEETHFDQLDLKSFCLNPSCEQDYETLFSKIGLDKFSEISFIICFPLNALEVNDQEKKVGFNFTNPLKIYQGIKQWIAKNTKCYITFVSSNQYKAIGNEEISPAQALLEGPLMVFPQESHQIACKCIDIGPLKKVNNVTFQALVNEIANPLQDKRVALRGKNRYVRQVIKFDSKPNDFIFMKGATYAIVGGLGVVGRKIVSYLADQAPCKIGIMVRSSFPPKSEWRKIAEDSLNPFYSSIIQLLALESKQSEVFVYKGDVSNKKDVEKFRKRLLEKYGSIHGVIHAGGVVKTGLAETLELEKAMQIFSPKLKGSDNLIDVFLKDDLVFLYLFSSLASISGYIGAVAYSSANAYQDALSVKYQKNNVHSISWSSWRKGTNREDYGSIPQAYLLDQKIGLSDEEGCKIFELALQFAKPHTIVSKIPIDKVLSNQLPMQNMTAFIEMETQNREFQTKSVSQSESLSEKTEDIINELSSIWKILLKHENFHSKVSFFEVGGHSILATQLISRINAKFNTHFKLKLIFESPSIEQLAKAIENAEKGL